MVILLSYVFNEFISFFRHHNTFSLRVIYNCIYKHESPISLCATSSVIIEGRVLQSLTYELTIKIVVPISAVINDT